jgi:predicted dehydrogenase
VHAPASWCQVYVATIHPTHYAITKMALEAGKSCVVEKPFGMNAREASELAELAKVKGVFLMEAMWTACLPATIEALRMVSEGEIGEVQSANASVGGVWYSPADLANANSRAAAKTLGSGVLLDVGCCVQPAQLHIRPASRLSHDTGLT